MIEILVLYRLCKRMGEILRAKGRKPLGMQVALVVSWFGLEFVGGMVGAAIQLAREGEIRPGIDFISYAIALLGAVLAAFVCFRIAKALPDERPPSFDPADEMQQWQLDDAQSFE